MRTIAKNKTVPENERTPENPQVLFIIQDLGGQINVQAQTETKTEAMIVAKECRDMVLEIADEMGIDHYLMNDLLGRLTKGMEEVRGEK